MWYVAGGKYYWRVFNVAHGKTSLSPRHSGRTLLYRAFDAAGALLYVGVSNDFRLRYKAHARSSPWFRSADCWSVEVYQTRAAALDSETRAIKLDRPAHNVMHACAAKTSSA